MGASRVHEVLVMRLVEEIRGNYGVDMDLALYSECSLMDQFPVPPIIDKYRPDVYAKEVGGERLIIGEAKTPKDLETERSLEQITSFVKHLANAGNGILILAVPWYMTPAANNILRSIKNKFNVDNVTFSVLEKLPG